MGRALHFPSYTRTHPCTRTQLQKTHAPSCAHTPAQARAPSCPHARAHTAAHNPMSAHTPLLHVHAFTRICAHSHPTRAHLGANIHTCARTHVSARTHIPVRANTRGGGSAGPKILTCPRSCTPKSGHLQDRVPRYACARPVLGSALPPDPVCGATLTSALCPLPARPAASTGAPAGTRLPSTPSLGGLALARVLSKPGCAEPQLAAARPLTLAVPPESTSPGLQAGRRGTWAKTESDWPGRRRDTGLN